MKRKNTTGLPDEVLELIDKAPIEVLMKLGGAMDGAPEDARVELGVTGGGAHDVSASDLMIAINSEMMTRITMRLIGNEDQEENARNVATMGNSMVCVLAETLNEYIDDPANEQEDGPIVTKALANLAAIANNEIAARKLAGTYTKMEA